MVNKKFDIYHLYHSGTAVVSNNDILIFDYSRHNITNNDKNFARGTITKKELQNKENIYVFVSHRHGDHYNSQIFSWEQELENNIYYILSNDIRVNKSQDNYYFVDKYDDIAIKGIEVNTFDSTDRGVSFLVNFNEKNIFHAGDLNWWHWQDNSKSKQKQEEKNYKDELDKIKNSFKELDIAFIPVDPRLDEYYYLAGEYFARKLAPKYIIPLHFGSQFEITQKFADKIKELKSEPVVINKNGQKIEVEV